MLSASLDRRYVEDGRGARRRAAALWPAGDAGRGGAGIARRRPSHGGAPHGLDADRDRPHGTRRLVALQRSAAHAPHRRADHDDGGILRAAPARAASEPQDRVAGHTGDLLARYLLGARLARASRDRVAALRYAGAGRGRAARTPRPRSDPGAPRRHSGKAHARSGTGVAHAPAARARRPGAWPAARRHHGHGAGCLRTGPGPRSLDARDARARRTPTSAPRARPKPNSKSPWHCAASSRRHHHGSRRWR